MQTIKDVQEEIEKVRNSNIMLESLVKMRELGKKQTKLTAIMIRDRCMRECLLIAKEHLEQDNKQSAAVAMLCGDAIETIKLDPLEEENEGK